MHEYLLSPKQRGLRDEVRDLVRWVPRQMLLDMDADKITFHKEFLQEAGSWDEKIHEYVPLDKKEITGQLVENAVQIWCSGFAPTACVFWGSDLCIPIFPIRSIKRRRLRHGKLVQQVPEKGAGYFIDRALSGRLGYGRRDHQ